MNKKIIISAIILTIIIVVPAILMMNKYEKFYIEDNQIHAVLPMDQVSENLLMMQDTYVARTCHSPYVQPALLLSVLEKAKMCMRDDAMMVLQLYEGWKMEALEALLGPGEESLQLCEYVMPFR